jgi:hypothetical protein
MGVTGCKGCSKCLADLTTKIIQMTIGPRRTQQHHAAAGKAYRQASSDTERKHLLQTHGARDTDLNRLPYVDVPRIHTADLMHALFLGAVKELLTSIKQMGWLSDEDFSEMESQVKLVNIPREFGARPVRHIEANMSKFKADQVFYQTIHCAALR